MQSGRNALHWAAREGHVAAVNKLMEWDPKLIDARNEHGTTPFIKAANKGHVDVMKALLEWGGGALLDIKNIFGDTPWDKAEGKPEIREIMQKYKR
ncbi:unnamed protein product [Vitrella brassicaformis CCMP3155]|uniref:Uncharacterized protein n=1 Tax=Vitrella brassicaformis (strain CCMP3155) TaxID=1169540 RepID=A0A0G4F5H8_VITBC|nr:unnamed protein product [Vitrella brassicaformis CCMP3155]|eukprot:CEM07000.1 unnamed protein product [Vitrella brassicaformis CCMP3155]